jgi:four helix bundle protein
MNYKEFEEIPVWKDAISLATLVFALTNRPAFRNLGDIANQIQRAALSVSNNIAEGFERGSTSELIAFLYYARGSAGEVRSICHVMRRIPELADFESRITEVLESAKSIGRQLGGWLKSLKTTEKEMPGQRHFSERDRDRKAETLRADAFMERIKKSAEEGIRASRARPNPE